MAALARKKEATARGARMLRTALGPAIANWLGDPAIVEIMLNPDGRLWIDRLTEGLTIPESGCRRLTASGSCVSLLTMSARRCTRRHRASQPSSRTPANASKA